MARPTVRPHSWTRGSNPTRDDVALPATSRDLQILVSSSVMHDNPRRMLERALHLPARPRSSLFIWGPRQTGKSTLLRGYLPGCSGDRFARDAGARSLHT